MSKKIAVLHHNDADGFGAAFAAWYGLYVCCPPDQERPEMKFIPVQYSQEPPLEELREFRAEEVYIVDFSYKKPVMDEFWKAFPDTLVIDHHKSALDEFNGSPSNTIIDITQSGAVLAWNHFVPQFPVPDILRYVQDRDLWKFDLPFSKEVNAFIATLPWDFEVWLNFELEMAVTSGDAILAFQRKQVQGRMKDVVMVKFGHTLDEPSKPVLYWGSYIQGQLTNLDPDKPIALIPMVNASENISDLGEAMCEAYPESPFSVSYCDRVDGKRSYSLRSRNGFDVSVVAKAFGGGGHPQSAGFTLPAPPRI